MDVPPLAAVAGAGSSNAAAAACPISKRRGICNFHFKWMAAATFHRRVTTVVGVVYSNQWVQH